MEKKIKEKAEEAVQEAQEVIEEIAEQPKKKSFIKSWKFWGIALGTLAVGLSIVGWKKYGNHEAEPKMIEDEQPTPAREYGNGNQNYNNKHRN